MSKQHQRLFRALAREGLDVSHDGLTYRVRLAGRSDVPEAEVLLPPDLPVESKAFKQLAAFASVSHPNGGKVCAVCATPDFHPGDLVPVGAVVATSADIVVPQAIGTDINCGMRLHVADMSLDTFLAGKERFVSLLKGDLLLGTRDLPMAHTGMQAIFSEGVAGLVASKPLGRLMRADFRQLENEKQRIYREGSEHGDIAWAPSGLVDSQREIIRDASLATVGGGNHFVELQVVDEVMNRQRAYEWGIKVGQLAFMVHSGSRGPGVHVGATWMERAKKSWPVDHKYPESGIFPLFGDKVESYMRAMATASNYGYVNRLLIAELVRDRLREVFGANVEAPLVYDVPHNVVFRENGMNVHRKGATPAFAGQPVIIPGSMGHSSYVLEGLGNDRFMSSASHGAGRALTRFEMGRAEMKGKLGLEGVECITMREERRIEEAPAAYKPIGSVIDAQVKAGIATPVAKLRPLLTFKG